MQPQKQNHFTDPPPYYILLSSKTTLPEQNHQLKPCRQLIELSASVYCNATQKLLPQTFHNFVKPSINLKLTKHCTEITGLQKHHLLNAPSIQSAIKMLQQWLQESLQIKTSANMKLIYTFMCWNGDDFESIKKELKIKKMNIPMFMHSYIHLESVFKRKMSIDQQNTVSLDQGLSKLYAQNDKMPQLKKLQTVFDCLVSKFDYRFHPNFISIVHEIPNVTVTPKIDYLLVLDFEATCEDNVKLQPCSEIIQFPIIIVDLNDQRVLQQERFHYYITPEFNKQLTLFCTELTGITQQMVTDKPSLAEVLRDLDEWIWSKKYLYGNNWSFITCGDWDLANCLKNEAKHKKLVLAHYLKKYFNVKKAYNQMIGDPGGMMKMLKGLEIDHIGRHHSGIDDVRNICEICVQLVRRGYSFERKDLRFTK